MANDCNLACTEIIEFLTDKEMSPNTGISIPPLRKIDGYRYLNIFAKFYPYDPFGPAVDLQVDFSIDSTGDIMITSQYVNFEENLSGPQNVNHIKISGANIGIISPKATGQYIARLPVMGPYVNVIAYNHAPVKRYATVWGYLVS